MKLKIFTLIIGLFMVFVANAATGDVVKMVDLTDASSCTGGEGVTVTDGTVVVKGVYSNWTFHSLTLTTPFELGKYTTFQVKYKVPAAKHSMYFKALDATGSTLYEGTITPVSDSTTMNTWIEGSLSLLKTNDDASKTRKTGTVCSFLFILYQTNTWGVGADDTEFSMKDFECIEGEDVAAPANNDPLLTYSSVNVDGMDIDGLDNEDVYDLVEFAPIDQLNDGDGEGISGEWASSWDNEYLYFFFHVEDDEIVLWDNSNYTDWVGDGFQFYLDVKDRRIDNTVFGKLTGTTINPGRESDDAVTASKGFQTSISSAMGDYVSEAKQGSVTSATSYTIEVAYPWKGLCYGAMDASAIDEWITTNVKEGLEISFDIQMNDNDGGTRVNVMSWCSPEGPYNNSGTWGAIKLSGSGTTSVSKVAESKLSVYPTMVDNYFTVELKNARTISLYSISGSTVKTISTVSDKTSIDASSLLKGIYIVKAYDSNGKVAVSKIIKD